MNPRPQQEQEIFAQMMTMLADQFSHQTGNNVTINRMELADMLTKQTVRGIEIGRAPLPQLLQEAREEERKRILEAATDYYKANVRGDTTLFKGMAAVFIDALTPSTEEEKLPTSHK